MTEDFSLEVHWLQAAARASLMSWDSACSAEYAGLAQLYLQYAEDAQKTRRAREPKT